MTAKSWLPKVNLDQELSLREKVILVVVMVGILLLFLNVMWEPQSTQMQVEQASLTAMNAQVDSLQQLIDATRGLFAAQGGEPKEELKVDEQVKRLLEKKVFDAGQETHDIVAWLGSRELAKNLTIRDVKVGQSSEKNTYTMVPFTLHVVGRYGAILNYFEAIEKLTRPVVIRRFTASKAAEKGGGIDALLELELYLAKR